MSSFFSEFYGEFFGQSFLVFLMGLQLFGGLTGFGWSQNASLSMSGGVSWLVGLGVLSYKGLFSAILDLPSFCSAGCASIMYMEFLE